jgi:hypothetical protein
VDLNSVPASEPFETHLGNGWTEVQVLENEEEVIQSSVPFGDTQGVRGTVAKWSSYDLISLLLKHIRSPPSSLETIGDGSQSKSLLKSDLHHVNAHQLAEGHNGLTASKV